MPASHKLKSDKQTNLTPQTKKKLLIKQCNFTSRPPLMWKYSEVWWEGTGWRSQQAEPTTTRVERCRRDAAFTCSALMDVPLLNTRGVRGQICRYKWSGKAFDFVYTLFNTHTHTHWPVWVYLFLTGRMREVGVCLWALWCVCLCSCATHGHGTLWVF